MWGIDEARRRIAEERERKTGTLDLGQLGLTELPVELFGLEHLERLNLGKAAFSAAGEYSHYFASEGDPANSFSTLPDALTRLVALSHLYIYAVGELSELGAVSMLVGLQELDCSQTGISTLDPLRNLAALQRLQFWGTKVSTLDHIRDLVALQSLDCSHTLVSTLEPLQNLAALRELDCSGTQISTLNPIQDIVALQSLKCSHTQISTLEPVRRLVAIHSLACSFSPVSVLDPVANLVALEWFDCSYTGVSTLESLRNLSVLGSLDCSNTQVSTLEPLRNLSVLESLDCSNTQVSTLEPLRNLSVLESLDCSNTQVSTLEPLRNIAALAHLYCSATRVIDIAPLLAIANLHSVTFNGSQLEELPAGLIFKQSLRSFRLHRTIIRGIPTEVLSTAHYDNCLERLRAHLSDLSAGSEEIRTAKVIALGNGRVGKTQICRQIRGLPFDPDVPSTHGISVTTTPLGGVDGDSLNLWDFGGQDIYHGAHSLFMRSRAVFLVIWHPEFERRAESEHEGLVFRNYPLSYWLEYVRTLAPAGSPIVVVQSQCDRRESEVKRMPVDDRLLEDPALKLCWYSAATGRGRPALNEAIEEAIQSIREHTGVALMGAGRARVLRQLEDWRAEDDDLEPNARQHRWLALEVFENLCAHVGGVSSTAALLDYLHQLGAVFYRTGLFHDRIILDQSWALDAVYALFERKNAYRQLVGTRGRFTRSLLELLVWREYSPGEQELFLSLMTSAGICFISRPDDKKLGIEAEYVAPDLLPEKGAVASDLAGRWDEQAPFHTLCYRYEFLHSGLLRALICDAGSRAQEAGVYWKDGLWVYDRASRARVLLEQGRSKGLGGCIVARVQGGQAAQLGQWLRERLRERNRLFGYPALEPEVDDFPKEREPPSPIASAPNADDVARSPTFDKLPASAFPRTGPEVFISYAWGDATPEGQRRQRVVDQLCSSLEERGVFVRRDRDQMGPGASIKAFMDRLARGDLIITVISDRYLHSPYCMYELFRIYRNRDSDGARFLESVIPLILPDARLGTLAERLEYARHWKAERDQIEALIRADPSIVGGEAFNKFRSIQEFSHSTSDLLEYLVDKLMPRDLDAMAEQGFREVLELVQAWGN